MKDIITYQDFDKLDLRVGKIIAATEPDWSEKMLEFKVDFGSDIGERIILAGMKKWHQATEFVGKNYLFIVNLAERKIGPAVSQGMMLAIDDGEKPVLFEINQSVEPGSIVR
ncbi:MAG: methionine--tRNA ligase [Candidatus Woesebacteria bacterium]|jgi:methionyl-tRNA synthetase